MLCHPAHMCWHRLLGTYAAGSRVHKIMCTPLMIAVSIADVKLAGHRRPPVVMADTLCEHAAACGRWNDGRRPGLHVQWQTEYGPAQA